MKRYYIHHNGYSWFVKEGIFFKEQGGLIEEWGKAWHPIDADSIEHARTKAELLTLKGIKKESFYLY